MNENIIILTNGESYEDNYSLFKGMKPYHQRKQDFINSIKSFKDIDDNKIREIFDFLGTEGYNDEENWHDGDIAIGFRRWIESKGQ